jgi:hypothetical protein
LGNADAKGFASSLGHQVHRRSATGLFVEVRIGERAPSASRRCLSCLPSSSPRRAVAAALSND